jgi:hypothetical protein
LGGFHNLICLNLPKPNSPHARCSVKCPNQPKMLQFNPNFSGTFTTLPVTYLPNFTPIRDPRLKIHQIPRFERSFPSRVPKSPFLRLNSNQAHTSLIFTYINLFVKYRLNSMSFRVSIRIPNLLWHFYRSNVVFTSFDLSIVSSRVFCAISLCVCIYSHFIYL